jgi:hypothetical protein
MFPFHTGFTLVILSVRLEKSVDCVQFIPSEEYMAKAPVPAPFKMPTATHSTPLYPIPRTAPVLVPTILCAEEEVDQVNPSLE